VGSASVLSQAKVSTYVTGKLREKSLKAARAGGYDSITSNLRWSLELDLVRAQPLPMQDGTEKGWVNFEWTENILKQPL